MPFVTILVYFTPIQVEKLGTSFTEAPECATVTLRPPSSSSSPPSLPPFHCSFPSSFPLLPHMEDFLFSSLVSKSQSRQNLSFPATLAARPSSNHPIRSQTIRNIQFICKLFIGFSN
ncbi:hypothetical protein AVEN_33269-1 [Araneus ventricosus]|uniref:Uncharacterized protein n=1 Tax=Araneus ventricosus TaxID=182803 RepID=A0A4Y2D4Z7_ARAVE|nr:hypothetical protein AVEN_20537-1 [Araneus ventricosus]GBM11368.1 hypothetical protein AVEN_33269-1 [Araneus ventricosus]